MSIADCLLVTSALLGGELWVRRGHDDRIPTTFPRVDPKNPDAVAAAARMIALCGLSEQG
jgi:hypothetical protein